MGKTTEARRRAKEHGITEEDRDIFLSLCLKNCPEIFSSFDPKKHAMIQKYAGLIHFGHLWHIEGTAQKEDVLTFTDPLSDVKTPTPTYVPALGNMQEELKKTGASLQEAMNQAIRIALPWMIQVMKHYRAAAGVTLPQNLTLNFNAVGVAVREDPHVLNNNPQFQINPESGLVSLAR